MSVAVKSKGVMTNIKEKYSKQSNRMVERIRSDSLKLYETIVGRFNAYQYVPTKVLTPDMVPEDDRDFVESLGAIRQEDGSFFIPDDVNADQFQPWFKQVPEDLRDQRADLNATRDGYTLENYLTPMDILKGADSLALPLVYLALPVLTAAAYMAGSLHAYLSVAVLLLLIPHIWTIAQSEGFGKAFGATALYVFFPLALASMGTAMNGGQSLSEGMMASAGLDQKESTMASMAVGGLGIMAVAGLAVSGLTLLFFIGLIILLVGGEEQERKRRFGGFMATLRDVAKWSIGLGVVAILTMLLPFDWMRPVVVFPLACLTAMFYTQREYDQRTKELAKQAAIFNRSDMDPTTVTHTARETQVIQAANDISPLFIWGTSTGYLAKSGYTFAPDGGLPFAQSLVDLSTHLLVLGKTGTGKTKSALAPHAVQVRKTALGGYFDCGKGALVNDLRALMDVVIEPGIAFAYFEGMNAQDVSIGFNNVASKESDGKDAIWREGAAMLIDHISVLHEALHQHEIVCREIALRAIKRARVLRDYAYIDWQKAIKEGHNGEFEKKAFEAYDHAVAQWNMVIKADEQWLWNVDTFDKVKNMVDEKQKNDQGLWMAGDKLLNCLAYLGYQANDQRRQNNASSIHPGIDAGHLLDHTIRYFTNVWPQMDDGQRSSFGINVDQKVQPLMRGAKLTDTNGVPWSRMIKGVDVMQALYGKFVGVSLSRKEHGLAAQMVSSFVKQRMYKGIYQRLSMGVKAWEAQGQKPMIIMWDECQTLVTQDELDLLPQAREAGASFVFATQNVENIFAQFGREKGDQFLSAFSSRIAFRCTADTQKYLSNEFGTARLITFKERVMGIDWNGLFQKAISTPYNDVNHPNHVGMTRIRNGGGEKLNLMVPNRGAVNYSNKSFAVEDIELTKGIQVPMSATLEERPLFAPHEFESLLQGYGKAICYVMRGGVPRVDLVNMNYVDANTYRDAKSDPRTNRAA